MSHSDNSFMQSHFFAFSPSFASIMPLIASGRGYWWLLLGGPSIDGLQLISLQSNSHQLAGHRGALSRRATYVIIT
jgi:hypothetical protein